jgi:hypothetical protein
MNEYRRLEAATVDRFLQRLQQSALLTCLASACSVNRQAPEAIKYSGKLG